MDVLPNRTKAGYSVGHVLNDLCAAMWFSYLLVYFHQVLELNSTTAGYLLLAGQLTDGLATPLVGIESDRFGLLGRYYGRRKSWHAFGCFSVLVSFVFIFTQPPNYNPDTTPEWVALIYYIPFIIIFQVGWASTQVSHLSIIPNLTHRESERTKLNSYRYGFTVLSSVMVYAIAFALLKSSAHDELGYHDVKVFSNLALTVISIGAVFVAIFHWLVPEEKPQPISAYGDIEDESERTPITDDYQTESRFKISSWQEWLGESNFFLTGVIYMCSRLIVNLSQVYMPFYLTDVLNEPKSMIAVVPLVIYLTGFLMTLVVPIITQKTNSHVLYFIGCVLVMCSSGWSYALAEPLPGDAGVPDSERYQVIGVAIFNGAGTAAILVSSLSLTAQLIGENTSTAAFVYGAMSLTDKIANGVAVIIVQNLDPCACDCEDCGYFFRSVTVWVVGAITVFAAGVVGFHYLTFHRRRDYEDVDNVNYH